MSKQDLIESVKDVRGKNVAYCCEDKAIYYSPNRVVDRKIKRSEVCHSDIKDLYRAVKHFKSENPEQKVKIIRV